MSVSFNNKNVIIKNNYGLLSSGELFRTLHNWVRLQQCNDAILSRHPCDRRRKGSVVRLPRKTISKLSKAFINSDRRTVSKRGALHGTPSVRFLRVSTRLAGGIVGDTCDETHIYTHWWIHTRDMLLLSRCSDLAGLIVLLNQSLA